MVERTRPPRPHPHTDLKTPAYASTRLTSDNGLCVISTVCVCLGGGDVRLVSCVSFSLRTFEAVRNGG